MPAYRCRTFSVATNKCPILPYRGVARTGVCFALEIMLDAVPVEAGIEPGEVRLRNLVGPDEMPFDNITNKHFDSGDYPQAMRRRWQRSISRPCGRVSARKNRTAG
jgi:carbon-monoxide dehydrogenase large subunit